jgi:DNA-binding IclR family transcriptional regulator
LLLSLGENRGSTTLSEIASHMRGHPSTTYRLLAVLERYGFARRDPRTGRYDIGLRLAELGYLALSQVELRGIARPTLQRLMEVTGETIHLMLLDGDRGIYIDRVESPQRVRVASNLGECQYLHSSAVGKALLAFLPEEKLAAILSTRLPRFTSNTITSASVLRQHLAEVQRRGYAIDDCEGEDSVRCVGAPIFDHSGQILASISIAGPAYRLDLQQLKTWGSLVRQAAMEISALLGYRTGRGRADAPSGVIHDGRRSPGVARRLRVSQRSKASAV